MTRPSRWKDPHTFDLRRDYRAHIPIAVASGLLKGETVTWSPRGPSPDPMPWAAVVRIDGVLRELRFYSSELVSTAWKGPL